MLDTVAPISKVTYNNIEIPVYDRSGYIDINLPDILWNKSSISYFWATDNLLLVGADFPGGGKLLVYDMLLKEWTVIESEISNVNVFYELYDSNIMLSGNYGGSGVEIFNPQTKELKRLYDSGYSWNKLWKLSNNNYLIGSAGTKGLLLYDTTNQTITKIYDTINWAYAQPLDNGDALLSTSSSYIYKYNSIDNSITQIYDISSTWSKYNLLPNGDVLIGGSLSTAIGILLYDHQANSISKIWDTSIYWTYFYNIDNEKTLCMTDQFGSNGSGILVYNNQQKSLTQIYTDGKGWRYLYDVGNGKYLISSVSTNGILLYDSITNSISLKYSSDRSYTNCVKVDYDYLLSGPYGGNAYSLLLYNHIDDTVTALRGGYSFTVVNEIGSKYIISSTDKEHSPQILEYDPETKTVKMIGYSIKI